MNDDPEDEDDGFNIAREYAAKHPLDQATKLLASIPAPPAPRKPPKPDGLEFVATADLLVEWCGKYPALFDHVQERLAELQPNGDGRTFKRWSATELVNVDTQLDWLVKGLIAKPTYGADSGELKTLKSYIALFRHVAIASGKPVMGRWSVPQPERVLSFVGEGGRIPYSRRLKRVMEACEIDPADIEGRFETIFNVAPLGSDHFTNEARYALREYEPALTHIDPLYAYQPTNVKARDLVDMGSMLTNFQRLCEDNGSMCWVTAHMNQTGTGFALTRITGAGVGEWVDSWTLLKHREPPDVPNGRFRLLMEVGSRQWGGSQYHVDLNLGRFDPDLGIHDGPITFKVDVAGMVEEVPSNTRDTNRRLNARRLLMEVGRYAKTDLTKTEIIERAVGDGVGKGFLQSTFALMVDDGTFGVVSLHTVRGREVARYRLHGDLKA